MAEPLSIAASAAGLLTLALQTLHSLVEFYQSCSRQDDDIQKTTARMKNLLGTLDFLSKSLQERKCMKDQRELVENIENSIRTCEINVHELQEELTKFDSPESGNIRGGIRRVGQRIKYPFKKSTLEKLNEEVDEIRENLSLALIALQGAETGDSRDELAEATALLNKIRTSQISSDIQAWLTAPDATVDHDAACKKRHGQSGRWFVRGQTYANWLWKENSTVWINGFAGCGKTILASTAIQYAYRHRRPGSRTAIAFFFFRFDDTAKQNASAMVRALILQLSSQLGEDCRELKDLCERHKPGQPPLVSFLGCLKQLLHKFQEACIFIDAIDESPRGSQREEVLQTLVEIKSWHIHGLHAFFTSRDEVNIRDVLQCLDPEEVHLRNDKINHDIEVYVRMQLESRQTMQKWTSYFQEIEHALAARAQGNWRYVDCQLKTLEAARSPMKLRKALETLPSSLDETYERILLSIDHEDREDARRLLQFLCFSYQPLTDKELVEVLAVELGESPRINGDRRYQDPKDLLAICPGLVEKRTNRRNEYTLHLAHYSVQEYFESERIKEQRAALFTMQSSDTHTELAQICIAYLLGMDSSIQDPPHERTRKFPFAGYAAMYWSGHYIHRSSSTSEAESYLQQLLVKFFITEYGAFRNAFTILDADALPLRRRAERVKPSALYYASRLGIVPIVASIIGDGGETAISSIDKCEGYLGSPFLAAVCGGHQTIVELMLEKGANRNVAPRNGLTALHLAARDGCVDMVKLLLKYSADDNAQDATSVYALQAAAYRGAEEIVMLLLDRGADINAQGGKYGNALQAASMKGHEGVVKLLLEKGVNVNAQSESCGSALQAASMGGHEGVVKLLLEKGVDINAQSGWCGNALQAASIAGHEGVIKLLLQEGADINAQGGLFNTAIQAAAFLGHIAGVEILVNNGADVAIQGGKGGSALAAAFHAGHLESFKFLLANGADIADLGPLDLALCSMCLLKKKAAVEFLLGLGVDPNAHNEHGTALENAHRRGNNEIVRLLLAHGARWPERLGQQPTTLNTTSSDDTEEYDTDSSFSE